MARKKQDKDIADPETETVEPQTAEAAEPSVDDSAAATGPEDAAVIPDLAAETVAEPEVPGEFIAAGPEEGALAGESLFGPDAMAEDEAEQDQPHDHHDDVDEHGLAEHGSFPTWLKVAIILLFGMVLALWGGPRLAPLLPAGLEPVAQFLAPGAVRQAQQIDARLSALEQKPATSTSPEAIDAAVAAALVRYETEHSAELAALRDTVSAVDGADIESRLTQVETAVQGLEAQMTSLSDQLTAAMTEGITQQTAEQAAANQASLDRLRTEIDALSGRQGSLQQAFDELSAANARIQDEAKAAVETSLAEKAATDIAVALESGAPFPAALQILAGAVEAEMPALRSYADRGAPSPDQLKAEFPTLAYAALRASMRADAEGYTDRALAYVRSQVATRSLTPREGDGTDAVLSRMEAALHAGDLAAVQAEAQGLSDAARAPLAGWLETVAGLAAARAELAAVAAQIPRQKG